MSACGSGLNLDQNKKLKKIERTSNFRLAQWIYSVKDRYVQLQTYSNWGSRASDN